MSTTTPRLGLKKPATSDYLDTGIVPDLDTSMQNIDDLVLLRAVPAVTHNLAALTAAGDIEDSGVLTSALALDSEVVKLLGRIGGQIVYGGTASGNNLELHSTSNATKGLIKLGANSAYDQVNNRLGINKLAPLFDLDISHDQGTVEICLTGYGTGFAGAIISRAARGSLASPSAVLTNDTLFIVGVRGYGATGFAPSSRAALIFAAAEDWTDAAQGTIARIETAQKGTITRTERVRVDDVGRVGIGKTPTTYLLEVNGDVQANYFRGDGSLLTNLPAAGSAFWTTFPGTPTRISDTSFSVTDTGNANLYDKMYSPGTVIKWEKSGGGFQCAKITAASYGANAVTYTIIGNTLAAGFTTMKYCIHRCIIEQLAIPGTMPGNTATANIAKPLYATCDMLILSAQPMMITSPTTTNGVFDINAGASGALGTTIFTTKLVQTAGQVLGVETVCDCVLATADTVVAKNSLISVDYDSGHATTPGADATIKISWIPESWRYIS